MIQAIIFDMDGVLIDSEPLWRDTAVEVFQSHGADLTDRLMRQTTGLRTDEFVGHWHDHFHMKTDKPQLIQAILDDVCRRISDRGEALPHAMQTLAWVREKGYPMALATSSPFQVMDAVLDRLGLTRDSFDAVLSAEPLSHGKPHPAIYLEAAKALGLAPTQCLAIEDSVNGMVSAKAARMFCFAVPEEQHRADPRFGLADKILDHLGQLSHISESPEGFLFF